MKFIRFAALLCWLVTVVPAMAASAPPASAAPLTLAPSAMQQMLGIQAAKARSQSTSDKKIDSRLLRVVDAARTPQRYPEVASLRRPQLGADGKIRVEVVAFDAQGVRALMKSLDGMGITTLTRTYRYPSLTARLTPAEIDAVSQLAQVRRISEAGQYLTARMNIQRSAVASDLRKVLNVSQGDAAHNGPLARNTYGVNGSGQKVCVISDGVDSLAAAQASGDLPAVVSVLPGQAGTGDEGTAMLEIVHDLAPGAALGFATADPTSAQFATNILGLAAAGCTIIVDDIIYLAESPFHEREITDAVNQVTASGVIYFSSAGNEGHAVNSTSGNWEGNFNPSAAADPAPLAGANLHNFGDGGNSNLVTANAQVVTLHWADPWGTAATDLDLYILDGGLTTIFDASTNTQDGAGGDDDPVEIAGATFTGERLLIDKFAGSASPMLNMLAFRGTVTLQTTGTTRGHSAALAAYSVAAVDATQAGVPPFTTASVEETFTSDGPRRTFFAFNNTLLPGAPAGDFTVTGGIVRQKPDIAAADGVTTSAPGFAPFYGTSAAAPHAAAIAALIKQAVPAITPAQLRTALITTALDIKSPGVDNVTGYGIVMPAPALAAAGAVPSPFVQFTSESHVQVAGNGDAFIDPGEDWRMTINVTNAGGAIANNVVVTLIPVTPGVVVTSGPVTVGTVAAAANAAATPFNFSVVNVACGAFLDFTVRITYAGGTTADTPLRLTLGTIGAETSFSYAGAPVPIPDAADLSGAAPGAQVSAVAVVTGITAPVGRVRFSLDGATCSNTAGSTTVGLDHTFVNDLVLKLKAPGGTEIAIVSNADGSGNNFCQTLLDDAAVNPIQSTVSANAPFTGSFKPNAALAAFYGNVANGNWTLSAQDFFSGDTGNIRAFTVKVAPVVCNPYVAASVLSATKTVTGQFSPGGIVNYTIAVTNAGPSVHLDNAGNELVDTLPASLTVQSATANTGTAAFVGNQVTWNGALNPAQTATISISALVAANATGTISNQATVNYDANRDGTNEATALSDNPAVAGAANSTDFVIATASLSATKTVSAPSKVIGATVVYTIVLSNSGNTATLDNAGNELTDVLPAGLTLVSASATSGTAVATPATRTVTWNGSVPAAGSVTVTVTASINASAVGQVISNQASFAYDADFNGSNETTGVTDDPTVAGSANATAFLVPLVDVPALSNSAMLLLAALLAMAGIAAGRRRVIR